MALSAEKIRAYGISDYSDVGVKASTKIYRGSAVGDDGNGLARPLNAGDPFLGFATAQADNSNGTGGAIKVNVYQRGKVELAVSGAAITDLGKPVYASDDDTFVLTASTNSCIGRIVRFVSTGKVIVQFDATRGALGKITPLTDNSGGTAADTIAAIGGTYSQTEVRNAVASLAAKINDLAARIK